MKINPIELRIFDKFRYATVAFLVDRDDFLKDLNIYRKKINLPVPLPYIEPYGHGWEIIIRMYERDHDIKLNFTSYSYNGLDPKIRDNVLRWWLGTYRKVVDKFREKHHKNISFESLYTNALFVGVITDENCMFAALEGDYFKSEQPNEAAIVVNNLTTAKDVIDMFNYYKSNLKYNKLDTVSNIERDRAWYWLKKDGLSYSQIHKTAFDQGLTITRDGVIKAVQRYQKRLTMDFY